MKKYIPILVVFVSFGLMIKYEIENYLPQEWFVFDFIEPILIYGLGIIFSTVFTVKSFKRYSKTKEKIHIIPLLIVGFGLIVISGIQISKKTQSKDILLSAHYDGDTNGIRIELYENNKYEIHSYSTLGGFYKRGSYSLKNDSIILNELKPLGPDNDFMEDTLIIVDDKLLFHIDKTGNYNSEYFSMKIIENQQKE